MVGQPVHVADETRWVTGPGPQLLFQLRGLAVHASRLVAARLALASAAIAERPSGDWASCLVGAAAIAGSLAGPLPVRGVLSTRALRARP